MSSAAGWEVTATTGPAGEFHRLMPDDDTGPQIWVHVPPSPVLVLGSTQPDELVDREAASAAGIEVCRRRSGGGLVWIDPTTDCWIDVIVPRNSRLWEPDVGRAFHWLGRHWADVLANLGMQTTMHTGRAEPAGPAGRIWCFADLGHGELSLGGHKILGLSQRRTRNWIRLQSLLLGAWPGAALSSIVDVTVPVRAGAPAGATGAAFEPAELSPDLVRAGFPPGRTPPDPDAVAARFLATVPDP